MAVVQLFGADDMLSPLTEMMEPLARVLLLNEKGALRGALSE